MLSTQHVVRFKRRIARAFGRPVAPRVWYVNPPAGWSNDWDASYITAGARAMGISASVAADASMAEGDVVHFGSTWALLAEADRLRQARNSLVATIFHGDRTAADPALARAMDRVISCADRLDVLVTSCTLMTRRFAEWGIDRAKLRLIPLGVDLARFRPADPRDRARIRHSLGVPEGALCIGSFQKDGSGWGEGLEPKLIKGPDVFVETVRRLRQIYPNLFVLLSGPARGYVKAALARSNVPFRHDFLSEYYDVILRYQACDLCLVTSREEGGPKAVLEALACGVPLVSTKVGMSPDVVQHGHNGCLVEIEDVDGLVEAARRLADDAAFRRSVVAAGLETVDRYGWDAIAARYADEVYRPLMRKLAA